MPNSPNVSTDNTSAKSRTFQPVALAHETRAGLPTDEAAYHLNRATQTLRIWAMREDGPLRPNRVNGRLSWPVAELRRVLGMPA